MNWILLGSGSRSEGPEAQFAMDGAHAPVHHHGEAPVLCDPAGLVGGDPQLEPQDLRPDVHGLPGDVRRLGGRAEHVDVLDRLVHLREADSHRLAEDRPAARVDRADPVALALQVLRDPVGLLLVVRRGADDRDRAALPVYAGQLLAFCVVHGGGNVAGRPAMATPTPQLSACSRSASRSSTSSMPTDSRTRSAGTSSGDPAALAWVIRPGCSISDSTPPSDSASVNSRVRSQTLSAASSPSRSRNDTIPPKPDICFAAMSWPGWDGSPGYSTEVTAGESSRNSTTRAALAECRSMRTPSVLRLRSTSQASNGEATAPIALWL